VDDDAVALARRLGGTVVAVGVVGPNASSSASARTSWEARFEHAVAAGRHAGVIVQTELVTASDSAQAIALVAGRHQASVILLQHRGRGRVGRVRARRLRHRLRKLSHALVFTVGGR
jgi:nucleotide-binding universal stress UspA family protein